jgi:hypothetical protein
VSAQLGYVRAGAETGAADSAYPIDAGFEDAERCQFGTCLIDALPVEDAKDGDSDRDIAAHCFEDVRACLLVTALTASDHVVLGGVVGVVTRGERYLWGGEQVPP